MPFPAAPTLGSGTIGFGGTTAAVPERQKPLLFDKEIIDWERDLYPTASIVMKENSITRSSPIWSRWERKPFPHWLTVDVGFSSTETDLADELANSLTRLTRHDLWLVERTGEVILFNAASGTTDAAPWLGVTRGFGDVPAQAVLAGDKMVKVGIALPEGGKSVLPHYTLDEEVKFTAAEMSITTAATSRVLATAFNPEANKRLANIEAKRLELTGIIKRGYFKNAMGNLRSATGEQTGFRGLDEHCKTWTYNFGGVLTRSDFFGFIADGPGRYIRGTIGIACGSFIQNIINNWMMDMAQVQQSGDEDTLGFNVKNLKLVAGRTAKIFYESWMDESPLQQGTFYVFPLNKKQGSRWVTVSGPEWDGRLRLNKNIEQNDSPKYIKDEWYCFGGFDHGSQLNYGVGKGIEG